MPTKSQHIDLTEFFDSVDLGVDSIGDWSQFEECFAEQEFHRFACSTATSAKPAK